MLTIEIEIDGERAYLSGAEDANLLNFYLTTLAGHDSLEWGGAELDMFLGAMAASDAGGFADRYRRRLRPAIEAGSMVTIRIIETDAPPAPSPKRYEDFLASNAGLDPDG